MASCHRASRAASCTTAAASCRDAWPSWPGDPRAMCAHCRSMQWTSRDVLTRSASTPWGIHAPGLPPRWTYVMDAHCTKRCHGWHRLAAATLPRSHGPEGSMRQSPVAGCHWAPQTSQAGSRCMRTCTLQAPVCGAYVHRGGSPGARMPQGVAAQRPRPRKSPFARTPCVRPDIEVRTSRDPAGGILPPARVAVCVGTGDPRGRYAPRRRGGGAACGARPPGRASARDGCS